MVNIYIVAGRNQGKTTIASLIEEALVDAKIQNISLVDINPEEYPEKMPIEQRMEATRKRPVQIVVLNSESQRANIPTILARHWLQAMKNAKSMIEALGSPTDEVQKAHIRELDQSISDLKIFVK